MDNNLGPPVTPSGLLRGHYHNFHPTGYFVALLNNFLVDLRLRQFLTPFPIVPLTLMSVRYM